MFSTVINRDVIKLVSIIQYFVQSIVYDPKALDNEEKSADLYQKFCKECFEVSIIRFRILRYYTKLILSPDCKLFNNNCMLS